MYRRMKHDPATRAHPTQLHSFDDMLLALRTAEVERAGVFAALLAVASMIVAAVAGLARLWRGPLKGWEFPEQPLLVNRLVTLLSAVLMVLGFFYATPATEWIVLLVGGMLATVAAVVGVNYAGMIARYRRFRERVIGDGVTEQVPVLAGDNLTPSAQAAMKKAAKEKKELTDQQYFAGAGPYEATWSGLASLASESISG
jgi:hypothetical protein